MESEIATTTIEQSGGSRSSDVDALDHALVWVFPAPSTPAVALHWEEEGERIIGRETGCSILLSGNDISRRHASLRKSDAGCGVVITDLDSRNGVRVNGHRISSSPLNTGDVVRLGGWLGVVTRTPGPWKEIAPGLLGGAAFQKALLPLQHAASSDLPIILEGETGTGKEVVTRSLHKWSGRSGPLVAVNCAALPEALAEGELFGYRRGAFTGADKANPGFFRGADGGTLLLDEVTDLPPALQAKLLRVLEERKVQPLGDPRPIPIDVRIVVAGQQSLMEASRQGSFRPDLLARLDGLTVHLPTLRSRREDVLRLFSHFLAELGQGRAPALETAFVERLCVHDWPFNVRELLLLARRLTVLHGGESALRAGHLPDRIGASSAPQPSPIGAEATSPHPVAATPAAAGEPVEPVEISDLVTALRACGGNVARAAAMLRITRQRAYRLMEGNFVDLEALRNRAS